MQTAKSEVRNPMNSKSVTVRILLDSGSQRTYVKEKLAEQFQSTRETLKTIKTAQS